MKVRHGRVLVAAALIVMACSDSGAPELGAQTPRRTAQTSASAGHQHAVIAHHFTMECYRRAARSSQTPNLNTRLLGTAAMLSRTMSAAPRG